MAESTADRETSTLTYGYYPGCSLEKGSKEYDLSLRAVCDRLGIDLKELEEFMVITITGLSYLQFGIKMG